MAKRVTKKVNNTELDGKEFFAAIAQIEQEKGIKPGYMMEKISQALLAAYRRDHEGVGDNLVVDADPETNTVRMFLKKDVVETVTCLTPEGTVETRPADALAFGYRTSVFEQDGSCVLSATLHLARGDKAAIRARMAELLAKRREKQPLEWPSAGSTFKRPQGAFAAALIEQCGLKGLQVGGAAVSQKHSGFVVNLGGATCADVIALTEQVIRVVKEKTGYTLEREIRVVK